MNKATKIWLIAAASLVIIGLAVVGLTVCMADDWSFNTMQYETNTYEITQEFDHMSIHTNIADIVFLPSDDKTCRIVCYEPQKMKHSASVQDDTLTIHVVDTRKWYDYITFFSFSTPKITVYLPRTEYVSLYIKESTGDIEIPKDFQFARINISASTGDVRCYASASELINIELSTGDICVENTAVGALDLSASTGDISISTVTCEADVAIRVTTGHTRLTDVVCKGISSSGSTGDMLLQNVIAAETIFIQRSTGDVTFEQSDAAELFVKTNTGRVRGSLLTDKVFLVQSDTGHIDVPKTVTGGRCEISTDTGDIKLTVD